MVYNLLYRRPTHVSDKRSSLSSDMKQKSINESISSGCSCTSNGIPAELSFDRIIEGGTCPPCTLRDFMNYLKYVEFAAENLQFYLWFRSYEKRFAQLSADQQSLSPEWTKADADLASSTVRKPAKVASSFAKEIDFDGVSPIKHKVDPFNDGPQSPPQVEKSWSDSSSTEDEDRATTAETVSPSEKTAELAFEKAGLKLMPFSSQPFRSEILRIITSYIAPGASRELNLSGRDRQAVLHALQKTTHPSAFKGIMTAVEFSLRKQAHPNFIRWAICNGNGPRVLFARGLGIFFMAVGLVVDLVITLSHAGRAWRVLPFIVWFLGIATLIAAWKGMCVVLHGLHHQHVRPWELFEDDARDDGRPSWDSLTSSSSNSFENEAWVDKYQKRNTIRKIFDREIWVKEPALRQIQDTIFLQSLLSSFVLSCIIVGIFCAVPAGNLF